MEGKKWYKSKTMWVNILAACIDVATGFATGGAVTVLSAINLVLRALTDKPITK